MKFENVRFVGEDEEVASSPLSSSFPSASSSVDDHSRSRIHRFLRGLVLSSVVAAVAIASVSLYHGEAIRSPFPVEAAVEGPPPQSLRDPAPAVADEASDVAEQHGDYPATPSNFVEDPPADTSSYHNPLPSSSADMESWSPFPVNDVSKHTLGYPFVAACTNVDASTKSVANRMAGEFDILDAFPNDEEATAGLFSQEKEKTWTYSFLLHDAEDLSYFLKFGLDYVPDLVSTRDVQDSRIGISHEDDDTGLAEDHGPGRSRRLAKPQCNDGTCRKSCGDCESTSQECTTCLGGGEGGDYSGTGECSVLTPIDYNTKFVPGLLGTTGYGSINNYGCYRTVLGTNRTVDDILLAYPNLTEKVILSDYPTVENSDYLYALVLTNKEFDSAAANPSYGQKGKVFATSSIHSREFAPAETMTRFAEYLLQNYESDPDIRWILDWNEIHLVLHANPDGRKYDEVAKDYWRKNRHITSPCTSTSNYGTDLNRNFPFKHNGCLESGCSSGMCSSETYRGNSEGSEQETKAIVEYAKTLFPEEQRWGAGTLAEAENQADLNAARPEDNTGVFMDVHSYGKYIGYAWGYWNQRSGNDNGLGALGRKMASYNKYRLWAPEMPANQYPVDGATLDTMYGWLGAASLFWELGSSFYQSCTSFPNIINEAFPGLIYAAKVAKSPYITSKGPDVLCVSLGAPGAAGGDPLTLTVDVSDSIRAKHADDGGPIFTTGGQNIASVELYVDCHPNSGCSPTVTETLIDAGTTVTGVALMFAAPVAEGDHALYVRAVDSDGYAGAVTARSFITCPSGGCPFTASPTPAPATKQPTSPPVTGPVCDATCTGCEGGGACRTQGCLWSAGLCRPR